MGFDLHKKHDTMETNQQEASSSAPPSYETLSSKYGIVSLNMLDKLRFIGFNDVELEAVKELVGSSWSKGINKTRTYNEAFEIQLYGTPWMHQSTPEGERRALIRNLLRGLYDIGWVFESSLTLTKKSTEKDSLIFKRSSSQPALSSWFTIAFDGYSILSIHNGPKEFCEQLVAIFSSKGWSAESALLDGRLEIRMNSSYWLPQGENTVKVRLMLLAIMETLDRSGCRLYASLMSASRAVGDLDQLICVQDAVAALKPEQQLMDA